MKIAFLVDSFPSISETFILNQITGLIDRGHEVDIYATRPELTGVRHYLRKKLSPNEGDTEKVHAAVHEYNLMDRTYAAPTIPANPTLRPVGDIPLFVRNMVQNPSATIEALKHFSYRNYPDHLRKPEYGLFYTITPFLESPRRRYDVIHCHFGPNGMRGLLLKKLGLLEGALITTFHGYDVTRYPKVEGKHVYDQLFDQCTIFTGGTNYLLDKVVDLGCPQSKCVKIPMGIDTSKFSRTKSLRGNKDTTILLTVARLTEKKGIKYGIRAFAQVKKQIPALNVEYLIVGSGVLREQLERLADELGVTDQIRFLGSQSHEKVRVLFEKADIFMLPSVTASNGDQEGQGLVIQEAQAMQLPVVSTLHNGIPEGVLPDESAFLVPERDVDALADRLLRLIQHPDMRQEMGRKGGRFVEENYDNEILIDQLTEIYRTIT